MGFSHKMKYFGFQVAFWNLLDSQRHRIKIFSGNIHQKYHNVIISWLAKNFKYFIANYKKDICSKPPSQGSIPKQIWICWWDGIGTMPPIVKACYNSVLRHANGFKITVITKDNFRDYISIPEHILEKTDTGIITLNALANIIRLALLAKYGGLWLDATVLVTDAINLDNALFFTIKGDFGGEDVPKRKWTTNLLGGLPKLFLFEFVRDFICEYWKKNDELIDYFLFDYSIALAYNSIPQIKEIIDSARVTNKNYMILQDHLGDEFNPAFFDETIKNTVFHKLTWKENFHCTTPENKLTLYGHILEKYGK